MKIGWSANAPWCHTGYAQMTALFTPRLRDLGHEVVIYANHGATQHVSSWNGITVLPMAWEAHGNDILAAHVQLTRPDLVITLDDAWPCNAAMMKGLPAAMWMPVDTDRLGIADERFLTESGRPPVAMSRHGEKCLTDAGFSPLYVPHGVDVQAFKPPEDREKLRAEWGVTGRFVIGICAANVDGIRKGFAEQFRAFADFRREVPEALLLVHSMPRFPGNQLQLDRLALSLGIEDAVRFSDQYSLITGRIGPEALASWYGVCDVLSACSYGEGFGLPVVESQACGTPVVVTDCSAMTELVGPGWLVGGEPYWNPVHEAWWTKPYIGQITDAYGLAYEGAAGRRADAREFATAYDADVILRDHWVPALETLAEKIAA
jgi:glycosyltransferase involved in cell wall biosynthesis